MRTIVATITAVSLISLAAGFTSRPASAADEPVYHFGLMGDVARPGVFDTTTASASIADLIEAAGGLAVRGPVSIRVIRDGQVASQTSVGVEPLSKEETLAGGDVVVVSALDPRGKGQAKQVAVIQAGVEPRIWKVEEDNVTVGEALSRLDQMDALATVIPGAGTTVDASMSLMARSLHDGDVIVLKSVTAMATRQEGAKVVEVLTTPPAEPTPAVVTAATEEPQSLAETIPAPLLEDSTEVAETQVTPTAVQTAVSGTGPVLAPVSNTTVKRAMDEAEEATGRLQKVMESAPKAVEQGVTEAAEAIQTPTPNSDSSVPPRTFSTSQTDSNTSGARQVDLEVPHRDSTDVAPTVIENAYAEVDYATQEGARWASVPPQPVDGRIVETSSSRPEYPTEAPLEFEFDESEVAEIQSAGDAETQSSQSSISPVLLTGVLLLALTSMVVVWSRTSDDALERRLAESRAARATGPSSAENPNGDPAHKSKVAGGPPFGSVSDAAVSVAASAPSLSIEEKPIPASEPMAPAMESSNAPMMLSDSKSAEARISQRVQDLESLVQNRLPVVNEETTLPRHVVLTGRPQGPERLRIDTREEMKGPRRPALFRPQSDQGTPSTAQTESSETSRVDAGVDGVIPETHVQQVRAGGALDRALSSVQKELEQ